MARINYDLQNDVLDDTQKVVTSTWSDNINALTSSFTSSTQADFSSATSKGAFFIDVYHKAADSVGAEVQYSIAYGHKNGSGSERFTNAAGAESNSPTRVIYSQYRQLVFGDENQSFNFPGDGSTNAYTPDDIYVINVNRSRYKNNLKPSTLNLTLSGSNIGFLHLTDDSITSTGSAIITNAGRQFNVVSGSSGIRLGDENVQVTNSGSYGLFYPDSGFIILNPAAVGYQVPEVTPVTSSDQANNNHQKLFNSINTGGSGDGFILDSEEKISSKYYFTRIKNSEFNFTTNPSFIDNSGNLRYSSMENNPKVYLTTIGLYNDSDDLVAVAKLSQPIAKDFTKEALIRVKLDY